MRDKEQGIRNKEQWERDNKTKESNLKGTIEGLEIWYVTQCPKHSYRNPVISLDSSGIELESTGITGIWNCHIYRYVLVARSSALKSNLYTP